MFDLKSLARHTRLAHVKIQCGSSTEVTCIKNLEQITRENVTFIQTNMEKGTSERKLALSHTHFGNTKHRGGLQISKE